MMRLFTDLFVIVGLLVYGMNELLSWAFNLPKASSAMMVFTGIALVLFWGILDAIIYLDEVTA